ncbi:Conidiation protein 6-domain-containing protein [Achaetomium macrosporum]|uniref:Conidiation protein 6-domain-containing protein n=1 Tax=Achaetomium macrosporum TaxID=79813 RepID=A0AAN7CA84_9PEZI|nr:Conidiation protein 6-domain-containing protein [Achaetomium macrosporum]
MSDKNRERGLKAAIHNPRVSEEAKQHDRELLASEFGEQAEEPQTGQSKRRSSTSKSAGPDFHQTKKEAQPGSSTAAHEAHGRGTRARRASSGDAGGPQQMGEEKDRGNVIRGLKAALKNPNVSEKAKEEDRKRLQEMGETVE